MADTVAQVRQTMALLRGWGFTVVEVGGWESRGSGSITTKGRLEHHTAGSRSGDTPSLRVVTFGRAGLRNALCRWYVSRSGVIYLVALRRSWHAGQGIKGSNATLSGTESENTGTGEPWQPRSLEAQAAISAAECLVYGLAPARHIWDHKEHAPRRKPDRAGIDPSAWRARVIEAVANGIAGRSSEEDDEDMKSDERSERVRQFQHSINLWMNLSGGWKGIEELGPIKADGHLGTRTSTALWHALERVRLRMPADTRPRSLYLDVNNPSLVAVGYITAAIVDEQRARV